MNNRIGNVNQTAARYIVSWIDAAGYTNTLSFLAPKDLAKALDWFAYVQTGPEHTPGTYADPAALFIKVNSDGHIRRLYYPEQLLTLKETDDALRDGWAEFTQRVHTAKAENCINVLEAHFDPQIPLPLERDSYNDYPADISEVKDCSK